jgi:hypothetical protein
MTAILKVNIEDLTADWLKQFKANHSDAEIEIHIRKKTPSFLNEEEFWEIINQLNWEADNNFAIVEPAIEKLSTYAIAKIYAFQELLTQKLHQLDTPEHARNIGEASFSVDRYFSVDNFLYARACVVANGKAIFEEVLQNPSEMPKDLTFEPLLHIAAEAYKRKTKRNFTFLPSVSYETYSNQIAWSTIAA